MNSTWKKRTAQVTALALSLSAMGVTAISQTSSTDSVDGYRTAGIVSTVAAMESGAYATANVTGSEVTVVAASEETQTTKYPEWQNRLMANVDEFLYVRAAANPEADIVGKMYKGDVAEVTGSENGWYQITSGNVTGYVLGEYCLTGDDAYTLATQVCKTYAKALEGGVRIRTAADANSEIYTVLAAGDTVEVATDVEAPDGWVAVSTKIGTAYISADLVEVSVDYGSAITIEEEQAAAQAAAEEAAAKQAAVAQQAAVAASYDDVTILAALIQHEAGYECYEGQLAVGAVVCNRIRSASFPNTVSGVIFQSGQFTSQSAINAIVAKGLKSSCVQAAQEALAGADNTGGCVSFRPVSSGRSGVVIGNQVFF